MHYINPEKKRPREQKVILTWPVCMTRTVFKCPLNGPFFVSTACGNMPFLNALLLSLDSFVHPCEKWCIFSCARDLPWTDVAELLTGTETRRFHAGHTGKEIFVNILFYFENSWSRVEFLWLFSSVKRMIVPDSHRKKCIT